MKEIKVKVTFIEDLIRTSTKDVYGKYIAPKKPDPTAIEDAYTEETTAFPRTEEGKPFLYDYQLKDFFKETCSFRGECLKGTSIDELIFIKENKSIIDLSGDIRSYNEIKSRYNEIIGTIENMRLSISLLGCGSPNTDDKNQKVQGERIPLSEAVPAGSTITFTVQCMVDDIEQLVRDCLDCGLYQGFGQCRRHLPLFHQGRFVWEEVV